MAQIRHNPDLPSPRTLLMLYASDLAFRLRWEIEPALGEGHTVIAAPYIQTAIAAGRAAGIPKSWLTALFQFAPRPDSTFRIREKSEGAGWTGRKSGGFAEFFCWNMRSLSDRNSAVETRDRIVEYLAGKHRSPELQRLTKKLVARVGRQGL